jgi:hypothetical protein
MATFDPDYVRLVLVCVLSEGLHLELLTLDENTDSKLGDGLIFTVDPHAILDDLFVLEGH